MLSHHSDRESSTRTTRSAKQCKWWSVGHLALKPQPRPVVWDCRQFCVDDRLPPDAFRVWLDNGKGDSYHLVCIFWGVVRIMTRPDKKQHSPSRKTGSRPAVAEAKVFMTGRSQAVRLDSRVTADCTSTHPQPIMLSYPSVLWAPD